MQLPRSLTPAVLACLAAVAGCGRNERPAAGPPPPVAAAPPSAAAAPGALHGWSGTWTGPEGTHLKLTAMPDSTWEVRIRNLDGERTFAGAAGPGHIDFERDGTRERIRPTDGDATGMKWLAGKPHCLTVRAGEGYCRDQPAAAGGGAGGGSSR